MTIAEEKTPDHHHGAAPYLDVVGVGAINLDYIIGDDPAPNEPGPQTDSLVDRLAALLAGKTTPFEAGAEHAVDEQTIGHALLETAELPMTAELGGSALRTVLALARLKLGLRLGFVGVAGHHPDYATNIARTLDELGIDHIHVHDDDALCGICLSVQTGGQRTLLTHAGANTAMAEYLDEGLGDVGYYLARARAVHVSSFLDQETPARLAATLQIVRKLNPQTLISVDPGHVWASDPTPDIMYILGLADLLHLNDREFAALGRRATGESDTTVAARLLDEINPCMTVAVKRPDGIYTARLDDGMLVTDVIPQTPIPTADILDDTGAGDVCAAGLLAALVSNQMQVRLGSHLGMQLARHTLGHRGSGGHHDFAKIAGDFSRFGVWPPDRPVTMAATPNDRVPVITDVAGPNPTAARFTAALPALTRRAYRRARSVRIGRQG
jgi:sugar/nucleoside kinase (ribokinase family)